MAKATTTRKSVSFPAGTLDLIERFPSRTKQDIEFSTKVQEIIRDLSLLLDRAQKGLKNQFTEAELNFLRDSLNGTILMPELSYQPSLLLMIEDSDRLDGYGDKWQVDVPALVEKVKALSEFECYALSKSIDQWWIEQ